jgi:carboxymethylenebutenolidase
MTSRVFVVLCAALLLTSLWPPASAQESAEEVVFPGSGLQLHGFLWKPSGAGPFRAVVWNHGSERMPGSHPQLAHFYTEHNYVFFVPHRRGQGRSPGPYIQDELAHAPPSARRQRMLDIQEQQVDDVVAAVEFLRSQSFVNGREIAVSGCSYGGIQTLLIGERELGIKALVPFAPGLCLGTET